MTSNKRKADKLTRAVTILRHYHLPEETITDVVSLISAYTVEVVQERIDRELKDGKPQK